jgi:DNA-binding NarL/FixJ family response regulator
MIRIAFIEDDHYYLQSLRTAIHLQPEMVCAITAGSIDDFWKEFPDRATLDIIFIDIDLPGQSGIEALPALRRRFPDTELVMLTQHEDRDRLLQSFTNGATGYLLKDFPLVQLPSHIHTLAKGGALISPQMARYVVEYFRPSQNAGSKLTSKEIQLLRLFSEGRSYEESAQLLGLTVDGVKYRVKQIYAKLNVNNKIDAIRAVKDEL